MYICMYTKICMWKDYLKLNTKYLPMPAKQRPRLANLNSCTTDLYVYVIFNLHTNVHVGTWISTLHTML
jgi:hypothetical protein